MTEIPKSVESCNTEWPRLIIQCAPGEEILAVRTAKTLLSDGYQDCIYTYANGVAMWARKTKSGVSVRQSRK